MPVLPSGAFMLRENILSDITHAENIAAAMRRFLGGNEPTPYQAEKIAEYERRAAYLRGALK